jgi:hypothetical protein
MLRYRIRRALSRRGRRAATRRRRERGAGCGPAEPLLALALDLDNPKDPVTALRGDLDDLAVTARPRQRSASCRRSSKNPSTTHTGK